MFKYSLFQYETPRSGRIANKVSGSPLWPQGFLRMKKTTDGLGNSVGLVHCERRFDGDLLGEQLLRLRVGRAVLLDIGELFVHVFQLAFQILVHIFICGQATKRRCLLARLNLYIAVRGDFGQTMHRTLLSLKPPKTQAAQYDSCKRCNCNANRHAFASEQCHKKQRPNRTHAFG